MDPEIVYADLELGAAKRPPPPAPGSARGCPRWHRAALGAGWTGNLLLGAALVALGCSVLPLRPEGPGSCRNGNFGDSRESVLAELRAALCPSGQPAPRGCRICPAGWTPGRTKCYWISKAHKGWNESREDCEARGATLLLPRDRDELELLNETLQKPGRSFWIGLWEPAGGTGWMWVNGSGLERHRCPLDIREGPGHCGATNGRAVKAQECGSELQWICQRGATEL